MNRLKRACRSATLLGFVFLSLAITMTYVALAVANRKLLPRYFPYSVRAGEHLRRVSEQGKSNIYLVEASGQRHLVGQLTGSAETKYNLAAAALEVALVGGATLALFVVWPREAPSDAPRERGG